MTVDEESGAGIERGMAERLKTLIEKWKNRLKKIIQIRYLSDGRFVFYILFPFRFDARLRYALCHATKPIEPDKIVFESFQGRGYGCNPKYIAEKLEERYPGRYKMVWLTSPNDECWGEIPEHIAKVRAKTQDAMREMATAKVYISNHSKIFYMRRGYFKRKGQYQIETWHGSLGIKRIGNDIQGANEKGWRKMAKRSVKTIDFWICNSEFESQVYQQAYWAPKNRIVFYGHPRNDILFGDTGGVAEKVRSYFGIGRNKKVLFYAPTFRDQFDDECYGLNYVRLRQALERRFGGEWVFLVRMHPKARQYARLSYPSVLEIYDASYYADIQELIACADCMISDYSSCIFDFMLTRRPGFIFATDIEAYNTERGFYYPLESTPFPIATDNDSLIRAVEQFDETRYRDDVEHFLEDKGCIEDGHAAERVVELIKRLTEGDHA